MVRCVSSKDIWSLPFSRQRSIRTRRALTELLVDKIIIEEHPSKIDEGGGRHHL
jgi:hypothetical protein